jgi:hypothetical protein
MSLTSATLAWPAGSMSIDSESALTDELSRLQAAYETKPTIVELTLESGDSLSIGLGLEWTVLSHVPASLDPPYHASVGDEHASGSLWFDYFGSSSEFPMTQAVRTDEAMDAMRGFLRTGELPPTVRWQQV